MIFTSHLTHLEGRGRGGQRGTVKPLMKGLAAGARLKLDRAVCVRSVCLGSRAVRRIHLVEAQIAPGREVGWPLSLCHALAWLATPQLSEVFCVSLKERGALGPGNERCGWAVGLVHLAPEKRALKGLQFCKGESEYNTIHPGNIRLYKHLHHRIFKTNLSSTWSKRTQLSSSENEWTT